MPHEVIDHLHCKAWQENASTRLSILNRWREEIPDELVHPHDMPDNANNDDTTDDDSSYHPKDDASSLPSMNELETESIAPIQAAPDEPKPIGVEVEDDNIQIKRVDDDNRTVVAEPNRKCFKRTLSRLLAVALRMYLTLHLLLFAQSM